MNEIKLINEKWLKGKKDLLAITAPGETRDELAKEIEEAEIHFAAKNAVIAAAAKLGYRPNNYAGTCTVTGEEVKPGCGFVKKNEAGKWDTYSWIQVQTEVEGA